MAKPLSEYKLASNRTVIDGHYRLRFVDVKVVLGGSGALYVVMGHLAINPGPEQGRRTELGFSCAETAESIARAWFLALGFKETECPPVEDEEALEEFMSRKIGKVVECDLIVTKNPQGYKQNQVDPPFGVVAAESQDGDLVYHKEEQPPF